MPHYTLEDLKDFTQNERKMVKDVFPELSEEVLEPSEDCVQRILDYSRALSVRSSKKIEHFRMVLN